MYIPNHKKGAIFIIGNSEELSDISSLLSPEDVVIRFNAPNPTCGLKADVLFVANGPTMVIRREKIFNGLLHKNAKILWRYDPKDILSARFQEVSWSRRVRYFLFLNWFKKKNTFDRYEQVIFNPKIYEECVNLVDAMPSSGFLAAYLYSRLYPSRQIYLHNFTFSGWDGHNWKREEEIISSFAREGIISFLR